MHESGSQKAFVPATRAEDRMEKKGKRKKVGERAS